MPCKKLRTKALWEQDRWLSYLPTKNDPNAQYTNVVRRLPTAQERLDFLRYDSHGGDIPADNIILAGKLAARVVGDTGWFPEANELKNIYFGDDGYWPGGLAIMEDYLWRTCGIVPLRKEFGDDIVQRWLAAFLFHAFGWPNLVA